MSCGFLPFQFYWPIETYAKAPSLILNGNLCPLGVPHMKLFISRYLYYSYVYAFCLLMKTVVPAINDNNLTIKEENTWLYSYLVMPKVHFKFLLRHLF